MNKTRLEAFSDGVIAILITILVLELKVPHGTDLAALQPLAPVFLTYVLSFVMLGIYWNNHHHLLHAADGISGGILWANLHLLFWLSLIPFVTGWMGENHFAALPTAGYGIVLLAARQSRTPSWSARSSPTRAHIRGSGRPSAGTSRATSPSPSTSRRSCRRWCIPAIAQALYVVVAHDLARPRSTDRKEAGG